MPTITFYNAQVSGSTWRETHCHFCKCVYYYRMTRVASGGADTAFNVKSEMELKRIAQRMAAEHLAKLLAEDFELVPCPNCGNYQPEMCEELREQEFDSARKRVNAIKGLSGMCFLAALLCAPGVQSDNRFVAALIASASLCVVFFVLGVVARRKYLHARNNYDANAGPAEQRLKIARKHALTAEQLKHRLEAEAKWGAKPRH